MQGLIAKISTTGLLLKPSSTRCLVQSSTEGFVEVYKESGSFGLDRIECGLTLHWILAGAPLALCWRRIGADAA
eukprot:5318306-Pyramimonas_sp.AAC.1